MTLWLPVPHQTPLEDGGEVYLRCLLLFGAILFGVYTLLGRRWRSWIVRLVSDREVAGSSPALGDTWRCVLGQDT